MNQLRRLIIALAAICVLALAAFAFVNRPAAPASDDDIIIKGGSLEIQCGKNHKNDNAGCFALDDGTTGKFKHKQETKKVTRIQVNTGNGVNVFDSDKLPADKKLGDKPEIVITYKAPTTQAQ